MRSVLPLLALLSVAGCLPEPATGVPPPRETDAGPPPDAELDAAPADAAEPPDGGEPDPDAMLQPDVPPGGQPCSWPADCPYGDCVDGTCHNERPSRCPDDQADLCPEGEVCGGFSSRYYCFKECELSRECPLRTRPCQSHFDCPGSMSCHDDFCINSCVVDSDCAEGGYCLEGECLPYPDLFDGDPPQPFGEPGQLYAGVGFATLDYPMGVSMAGFGGRPGPRTPYNVSLGGSDSVLEGQDVRVLVLSTDEDLLILVRLPLCWSTDFMMTLTAMKLQALTGTNYLGKIVTAATHSHSQPARYWNLVPATGFGIFGYGTFSNEMVQRYTDSFAAAIADALQNMRPARFGSALVDDFDPAGRVHSDRRGESPPFLDDRMLVWRVDDTDGNPIAGMVNFALHGTHMEHTWITADAPGGVEVAATERLSADYGRDVPVLFVNGNAGNVSPRGDDNVRVDWGKMQGVGHNAYPAFKAAFDGIETRADIHLEVVTRRVPIDYHRLGYEDGEFRWNDGSVQEYGAFQCVRDSRGPDDPYVDGELGCALNIQQFFGAPIPQMHKTLLTAIRLDDLVVTTLPGEPTSELGVALSRAIEEDAAGAGHPNVRAMQFGYSQDHHLYLLTSEDWFYGGYEASQGLWGWRLGQYLLDQQRLLAFQLFTDEREDNETGVLPTWWPALEDDTVEATATDGEPGAVVSEPPEALSRGDLFEMEWTGGHPGVDQPYVVLLAIDGDDATTAFKPGGRVFDHEGFESLTIYRGDYAANHTWAARWELPFWLPEGTYRLEATGASTAGEYRAASRSFTVGAAALVVRDAQVADGALTMKVNYPNGPTNDDGGELAELKSAGHWLRWRDPGPLAEPLKQWSFLLGPAAEGPLTVTVDDSPVDAGSADDHVDVDLVTARDADGNETLTRLAGWVTTRVSVPAPAAGAHTVWVTDAHGNTASFEVNVE